MGTHDSSASPWAAIADLAVTTAARAGRLLVDGRPERLTIETKSSRTDVVTQMDRAAEDLIVSTLLGARPDDGVLGEEGGERAGTSGLRWIVDPLDGTVNYLYGLPQWAVSIAAEVDGKVVVGVVEAPALGRRYVGIRGSGAWEEGSGSPQASGDLGVRRRDLHVSEQDDLGLSLVSTGFSYSSERRAAQAEDLRRLAPAVRDIRRLGAAALDLCWVAAGYVDGYFESDLKPWDLAAGGLIAHEAGALVTGWDGLPASEAMVLAATPGIHASLETILRGR